MISLTQEQFAQFAALSGDDNPIHIDPEFAARTRFERPAAHGMLLYSLLCAEWGQRYPGARQVSQELVFRAPTYAGQPFEIQVEPVEQDPDQGLLTLTTRLLHGPESSGAEGTAVIRIPPVEPAAGSRQPAQSPLLAGGPTIPETAESHRGLSIGQQAEIERTFTAADIEEYIALTGDANPLYTSPETAAGHGLDRPPLPGPLLGGLFSSLLGTRLPGRGTNWLKQRLVFPKAVYPGEAITARVEITRIRPDKDLVNLRTWCVNPSGEIVCDGEALVLVSDVEG